VSPADREWADLLTRTELAGLLPAARTTTTPQDTEKGTTHACT